MYLEEINCQKLRVRSWKHLTLARIKCRILFFLVGTLLSWDTSNHSIMIAWLCFMPSMVLARLCLVIGCALLSSSRAHLSTHTLTHIPHNLVFWDDVRLRPPRHCFFNWLRSGSFRRHDPIAYVGSLALSRWSNCYPSQGYFLALSWDVRMPHDWALFLRKIKRRRKKKRAAGNTWPTIHTCKETLLSIFAFFSKTGFQIALSSNIDLAHHSYRIYVPRFV